jgi:hypothetical protein
VQYVDVAVLRLRPLGTKSADTLEGQLDSISIFNNRIRASAATYGQTLVSRYKHDTLFT